MAQFSHQNYFLGWRELEDKKVFLGKIRFSFPVPTVGAWLHHSWCVFALEILWLQTPNPSKWRQQKYFGFEYFVENWKHFRLFSHFQRWFSSKLYLNVWFCYWKKSLPFNQAVLKIIVIKESVLGEEDLTTRFQRSVLSLFSTWCSGGGFISSLFFT